MAHRARSVILPQGPGAAAAALVLFVVVGSLVTVGLRADGMSGLRVADLLAIRFTVVQALVSAMFSVGLAVPVARALARRQFRGRRVLITLLGAPFILPVIVAVLGILAVFGRNGLLNEVLAFFGVAKLSIYGFWGVILAHVFFNLPLAVRFLLQGWLDIPAERFRLAASLGVPIWRVLELPMLRAVVPGAFVVIFVICLTSFAVALTLGGGPRATTIELAIYQAVRFDFDLGKAALLSVIQFALCAAAAVIAWRVAGPQGIGAGLDRVVQRWDARGRGAKIFDLCVLMLAFAFLILPLGMVVLRGLPALFDLPFFVFVAALRSVLVALVSTALAVSITLAMSLRGGAGIAIVGALPLAASSLVLGTGLFLLLQPFVSPPKVALVVTALLNAVMSLPFALRVVQPAVAQAETDFGRLASAMGLRGWNRLRFVILPRIKGPLGFAAGLSAALSMGDLGVIALFATEDQATLPLVMYQLMGSYRTGQSAGAALLLLILSLALFWIFDRGGRANAASE